MAVEFCAKILFEVDPESRKIGKGTGDKVWKFVFTHRSGAHTVFVATYKQEGNALKKSDCEGEKHMVLSMRQAGLLCMDTFARLLKFAASLRVSQIMRTPLVGAVFSRDNIAKLATTLETDLPTMIQMMSVSSQNGSHYLSNSRAEIAMCVANSATRRLKDSSTRFVIVSKITKPYISQNKRPDMAVFDIVAMYSTGGVP